MNAAAPRQDGPLGLIVAGAAGRMGRTVIEAARGDARFCVAAALEAPGHAALGRDAGEFLGVELGARITADAEPAMRPGACLIEFTRPPATLEHLAAADIPIVFAPNMAIGVNAIFKLADTAARILGEDFDVEIIEAHHRHKVDAPSGTALRLGEIVAAALGRTLPAVARHGREGDTGERDRREIGFHALRGGDIVGEHTVMFAGAGERVEITVRSSSRATYAFGALRAALFLRGQRSGLFDMQDVLGLR